MQKLSLELRANTIPALLCLWTIHQGVVLAFTIRELRFFHEGAKIWSCCKAKNMDFNEFMKIEGCKTGKHKFLKKQEKSDETVQCRFDWYQTTQNVIVSVYAKNVSKENSQVVFETTKLKIRVNFKDGKKFEKQFSLYQVILPEQSKFEVLTTKVEITLKKETPGLQWAGLE